MSNDVALRGQSIAKTEPTYNAPLTPEQQFDHDCAYIWAVLHQKMSKIHKPHITFNCSMYGIMKTIPLYTFHNGKSVGYCVRIKKYIVYYDTSRFNIMGIEAMVYMYGLTFLQFLVPSSEKSSL